MERERDDDSGETSSHFLRATRKERRKEDSPIKILISSPRGRGKAVLPYFSKPKLKGYRQKIYLRKKVSNQFLIFVASLLTLVSPKFYQVSTERRDLATLSKREAEKGS